MKKTKKNSEELNNFDSNKNPKLSRREALKRIANKSLGMAILTLPAFPAFTANTKQENKISIRINNLDDKENLYLDNDDPKDVVYSPDGYSSTSPYSSDGPPPYSSDGPPPYGVDCGVDHYSYSSIYSSYHCYYGT